MQTVIRKKKKKICESYSQMLILIFDRAFAFSTFVVFFYGRAPFRETGRRLKYVKVISKRSSTSSRAESGMLRDMFN